MRAAWRLALAGLSARRVRVMLLIGAVALSAALIASVSCAMASVNQAVGRQLETQLGRADARLRPAGSGMVMPRTVLTRVESWEGVTRVTPIREESVSLRMNVAMLEPVEGDASRFASREIAAGSSAVATGVPLTRAERLEDLELLAGRLPEAPGEVVIDAMLAERFTPEFIQDADRGGPSFSLKTGDASYLDRDAPLVPGEADADLAAAVNGAVGPRPGDTIESVRLFRRSTGLTIVGIARPPPLGGRPRAYMSLETAETLGGDRPGYSEVEIELAEGVDPDAFVLAHRDAFGTLAVLTTTERVTSGVEKNMSSNQVGFILASLLAFLSASFIIMTGLTTGLAEQQRALAVLRCIGATRSQLAQSQLIHGAFVGTAGAVIGVPMGIGFAWLLTTYFHERVPTGLAVSPRWLAVAALGSIGAGLVGAAWPAWVTSRMSPLAGLSARSKSATAKGIALASGLGFVGLAVMLATVMIPDDGQMVFWGYATVGLPAMFVGYFLLSVPAVAIVSRLASPVLTKLLRLPPSVLERTVRATPYRHGFTAGAMMAGLSLMVAVWTNGGAFLRDWLGRIDFPDAFVSGLALTPEAQQTIDDLPFVTETCAISLYPVETDAFGVRALQQYKTTFVAFEPEPFFRMASLDFVQGEPDYAKRRLSEGGAVIVAREFLIAKGIGVGETFTCRGADGEPHDFEIVGVVTSPGLELVSKFFNIGDEFIEQALHAVFGSRDDMRTIFGADSIQLIQIELNPEIDDAEAVTELRRALFGAGIMDAGSGRKIKGELIMLVGTSLVVFSSVAVGSMLIACFGVANLIAAGIHTRRFEFGVLRSVGGSKGLLTRLIGAEACIIALTACVVGTAMGLQSAWAGRTLYQHLIGVDLHFRIPFVAIACGWAFVITLTIGAAAPSMVILNRRKPRELLASGR
ncbi:MAG: ABC transporter [Phycisphaeraceae bacterium]|nr:MAG: ABC transporter [Phycisphaeraceae bacterium]